MKRILSILLAALIMAACSPLAATFVPLPNDLKAIILIVATAIVAQVLEALAARVPQLDLRQYTTQIAVAIAGAIVVLAEHLLGLIPAQYDTLVEQLLHLLVLILGGTGTLLILRLNKVPGFRSE